MRRLVPRATCSGTRTLVSSTRRRRDKAEAARGRAESHRARLPLFRARTLNSERLAAGNAFDAQGDAINSAGSKLLTNKRVKNILHRKGDGQAIGERESPGAKVFSI